jgi:hypothetical protein
MARPLKFPERFDATLPAGTLAAIDAERNSYDPPVSRGYVVRAALRHRLRYPPADQPDTAAQQPARAGGKDKG